MESQEYLLLVDLINSRFGGVDARLDGIDGRLAAHERQFTEFARRFDALERKVDGLEEALAQHKREMLAHFDDVYRRFERLEQEYHAIGSKTVCADHSRETAMPAYLIANVNVQDAATFEEYRKQVPATIAKHGGRYLVRGGRVERLEGSWNPTRLVVLEFPSMEQARRWYDSEDYRGPKALRMKCTLTDAIFVEGV